MKKSLFTALSLILCVALLAVPMVVSASTAVEKTFDPVSTMWYSVDFVRTSAADAASDAYVYNWTPAADGELTLAADTDCKDALISVTNTSDSTDKGVTYKYYPKGGFSNADGVTYTVNGGDAYKVSVMTASETSAEVSFFAYYTATSVTGLKGAGTYEDPYLIDNSVKSLPATKAGQTIYYLLSCDETQKYDLKVKGANTKDSFDLYVENNKVTASAESGLATVKTITPYAASSYIMFSITNTGTAKGGAYTYALTKAADTGTKGTFDDPATLVLDAATTANITSVCYYYTYTATEDGTLSVKINTADNWICSVSGGAAEAAYCKASDSPVVNPVEYPVTEGEEITLWVATEAFGAGTVSFTATLKTEEETTATEPVAQTTIATEPTEETTAVTEPNEDVTTAPVEPGEQESTASVPVDESNPATATTDPAVTTASTEPTEVTKATEATEPTEITTAPAADTDPEGVFSELYDGYCLSSAELTLGTNEVLLSKVYDVTLFEFTPSEYAEYKITADDANAIVGAYVGTVNYIPATAKGTANEVTISFTSGADIIVAVSNASSCTLTIEKSADVEIKEEESDWVIYENVVEVTDIETDVDVNSLTNVMIYDDIVNSAVLGADGYYHLDSADGEILYVNLNSNVMSFVSVVDRSKLCAVFYDENGNVTEKIDFTDAVLEYINNAAQIVNGEDIFYFYPLTADLIEMYQVVGLANDWYGRTGWVGGIEDDAWMFACYYEAGTAGGQVNPEEPVVNPGNPSAVATGRDFTVAYISVAVMLAAAAVVVFTRKKTAK